MPRNAPVGRGCQSQFIEAPIQERPGKSIADVMDWARENLCRRIEVGEMARYAGLSERTFLRRFREGAGVTPLKWLRRERIYRAMVMLETTKTPLDDVAAQCGFQSPEAFRIAFRQVAGTPPGAYRKRFSVAA